MLRRFLAAAALWFAPLALLPGIAAAQPATSINFTDRSLQIDGVLQRGHELEVQSRWGEALAHYEEALRQYPDENSLEKRFDLARIHYDLSRRYADRSFCKTVSLMPAEKAIQLYEQVLAKLQAHYVELPAWKSLVEHGTADVETALGEAAFLDRCMPKRNAVDGKAFAIELHSALAVRTIENRSDARDFVVFAANLAKTRLGIAPTAIILEYLCGATNSLDPYSTYLTPDQLGEVYSQIDGSFVGLGVELKAQNGSLVIVRVISGSPAEQAGVRAGDRIIAVDDRQTSSMNTDQAANMLQGPEGSVASLVLGSPGEPQRQVNVHRQRVEVPSVEKVRIIDKEQGVGYFRLTCFQKTTFRDVEAALWSLHRDGMRSLVIDLRGNPGGLLISSVEVADLFLDRGVIVSTHGRSSQEESTFSAHEAGTWHVPLTVIIDQESASAAEIFSGAIRDHHRGTIVGVRSFGKGSVQGIFQLDGSESGLRLTTAKFYSPLGKPYSRVGVEPDVLVRQTARPIDGVMPVSSDAMYTAALQIARKNALPR